MGSCASDGEKASGDDDEGGVLMSDCRERQVVMKLPKAFCDVEEYVGGLAGGEAKRPTGRREGGCCCCCCCCDGGCDESHDSAEGRSIVATWVFGVVVAIVEVLGSGGGGEMR